MNNALNSEQYTVHTCIHYQALKVNKDQKLYIELDLFHSK